MLQPEWTSSSVNFAAAEACAGDWPFLALALHAPISATALLRLRRASSSSSISRGETIKAAVRPCRVTVMISRCAPSINWPSGSVPLRM